MFGLMESTLRLRQFIKHRTWRVPVWLCEGKTPTRQWHPFLRSVPKPSVRWVEVEGDESAAIEINALGFRSPEVPFRKQPGALRIVCVGGSVVYDTRVDMRGSWAYQLESLLERRLPDRQVEVINAGLPGRTSADSLVNLGLRVLPLDPDIVVLVHGVNDQKPNRYPGFQPDYSHWYRQQRVGEKPSLMIRIVDHSLFAAHLRQRLKIVMNPSLHDNWRGEDLERFETVGEPGLNAYRRNLESMIAVARAQGAKVILCTVAHSIAEGNGDWSPASGSPCPLLHYHSTLTIEGIEDAFLRYNGVTRKTAEEFACPLVDWDRLMPRGARYFADDVHYSVDGASIAASHVASAIVERLGGLAQ